MELMYIIKYIKFLPTWGLVLIVIGCLAILIENFRQLKRKKQKDYHERIEITGKN